MLGAVFLAVTGGEALYADIGHFGTTPIRLTWFAVVLPALTLNYFGQGALLLIEPEAAVNPFLPNGAFMGALSDGRARNRGSGHCVAGDYQRRLFAHHAGHPARLHARA